MPRFVSVAAVAILPAFVLGSTPGGPPPAAPVAAVWRFVVGQIGLPHAIPATRQWEVAVDRHYGQPGNASGYSEILAAGRVLWAFGGTNPGGQSTPVAVYHGGRSWHASRLPAGLTGFISGASAPDARDIWAVSSYGGYVLHWNGKRWRVARQWNQPDALSGIVALSHRDVWVFGTSAYGAVAAGTWHFDGRSWRPVTGAGQDIYRASAVSAHDIWAIAAGPSGDSVVRYGRRSWRPVRAGRILAGVRWHDILAVSARDVWILGDAISSRGGGQLVLAHWDGKRWSRFATSLHAWAGELAEAGQGQVAATAVSSGLPGAGLIVEMTSAGHLTWWTLRSSLGSGVSAVAYDPLTHALWASGAILTRRGGNAALWTLTRRPALILTTGRGV
jgi:hypothetical protein